MQSLALRLMAILAYMLMPFAMGSAMAAPVAAPPHHESMMAMDGMGHCPNEGPARPDDLVFVGCAMMCAALPAAELVGPAPVMLAAAPPPISPIRNFSGIHLEIATPPPRTA